MEKVSYAKELPIYICFSKADYEFIKDNPDEYIARRAMVKKLLRKAFPEYEFQFYLTSIYNLYTIIHMISNGLRRYLDGYDEIQDNIVEYRDKTEIAQAILFDHTGLVISETFNPKSKDYELENRIDRIISGHLEFFGQLEDEDLDITSIRGVDGEFMNVCYQFHLYNDMELSEEQMKDVIEKRKSSNPYYANYYFSIISSLDKSILAENQITEIISKLQDYLKEILMDYQDPVTLGEM